MQSQLDDKSLKYFLRNPIGLIGLLAFLFDSVTGIVLSVGFDKFSTDTERLPMIWFLIGYPLLVLGLFAYLVIKRPRNLYGPQDYGDSSLFLQATEEQNHKRIEKEADEISKISKNSEKSLLKGKAEQKEEEKTQENQSNVLRKKELTQRISEAERIGLEAAEKELKIGLIPNVRFSEDGKKALWLDGFNVTRGVFTIVEIKLATNRHWKQAVQKGILQLTDDAAYMNKKEDKVIKPVLVLVTSPDVEKKEIIEYSKSLNADIICIVAYIQGFN